MLLYYVVLRCIVLYPVEDEGGRGGGGGEGRVQLIIEGLYPSFIFKKSCMMKIQEI